MIKYKKIYIEALNLSTSDWIGCEYCGKTAVDIHHIKFKSHCGKDEINNLIALCRECHNLAHDSMMFNQKLKKIAEKRNI